MAFDLDVHKRDSKGKIISSNPYRLVIENGIQRFERPPGSGQWFDASGTLTTKAAVAEPFVPPKLEPAKK